LQSCKINWLNILANSFFGIIHVVNKPYETITFLFVRKFTKYLWFYNCRFLALFHTVLMFQFDVIVYA
jgi:hypothetical protein